MGGIAAIFNLAFDFVGVSEIALVIGFVLVAALLVREVLAPGRCTIAGNFLVPAEWITSDRVAAVGLLWGLILGLGWITQAPFRIYHAICVFCVTTTLGWWTGLLVLGVFGLSRVVVGMRPEFRAWVLAREDEGRGWRSAAKLSTLGVAAVVAVIGLELVAL
jgi:hypothetical protein